jgi:hypothetical protein
MIAVAPIAAFAGSFTFTDTGLGTLAHGTAYTWGLSSTANSNGTKLGSLESSVKSGSVISSATLTITGLYDWTDEPADVLYVNLLNNLKPGNSSYEYDSSPDTHNTVFGPDIFDTVTKPTAPTAPTAPVKPTAPKAPTLTAPVKPTAPTPPTPLGPHPTPSQQATYNAALATYNAALATYNTKLATYNTALAAYNAAEAAYTAAVATYNAQLAAYNAAVIVYNANEATYQTALTAYNAALVTYNNYVNTQAALGFKGVSPTHVSSLYDQANSLLVAPVPNGPGTWTDPNKGPAGVTTVVITFSAANISLLDSLLTSDSATTDLGLGFGPDCHFYDGGVSLKIVTTPDAGTTLAMLGISLAGLLGFGGLARRPRRV